MNFFGNGVATTAPTVTHPFPDTPEFPNADLLRFEKEYLGFYITSHPLTEHQATIERYATASTRECLTMNEGVEVTLGGMINRVKKSVTKTGRSAGQPMAMVTLEDLEGQIDGVLFAETLAESLRRYPGSVQTERVVFLRGRIDRRRETPSVIVNELIPITEAPSRLTTAVAIKLDHSRHQHEDVTRIAPLLARHKGNVDLFAQVQTDDAHKIVVKFRRDMNVRVSSSLVEELDAVLGSGAVQLFGAGQRRIKRLEQQKLFKEDSVTVAEPGTAPATDEQLAEAFDDESDTGVVSPDG
jgi:DNA polymerase-3 subunit alpha